MTKEAWAGGPEPVLAMGSPVRRGSFWSSGTGRAAAVGGSAAVVRGGNSIGVHLTLVRADAPDGTKTGQTTRWLGEAVSPAWVGGAAQPDRYAAWCPQPSRRIYNEKGGI